MKYTVIGHFSVDVRHASDGAEEHRTYAGILNAVRGLASVCAPTDTVFPVFGVGERDYYGVKTALAAFPNVDLSGIYSHAGASNEVHVFPDPHGGRVACAKTINAPIPFAKIEPFLNVNGVLINMISGFDIALDTLDEIRMSVRPKAVPIHLDIHNLTLGVKEDATRFRRPLSDWRRWCFMINSVQMNAAEAAGLTLEYKDIDHLVKQIVPLMVQVLCITHGPEGAMLYEVQHKSVVAHTIEGISVAGDTSDDTVGCGDLFGAAFLQKFCSTKDIVEAGLAANKIASIAAGTPARERFGAPSRLKESG